MMLQSLKDKFKFLIPIIVIINVRISKSAFAIAQPLDIDVHLITVELMELIGGIAYVFRSESRLR
jgi:hypothetical protein